MPPIAQVCLSTFYLSPYNFRTKNKIFEILTLLEVLAVGELSCLPGLLMRVAGYDFTADILIITILRVTLIHQATSVIMNRNAENNITCN